jgi:cell division FtsZ-interacting protein ZapD
LLVFIGSSFIIKKLSKNIVLSLFTAMLISNFIFGCKKVTEGLSNKTSTEDLKGMIDLVQSGKVNTDGIKNVANMANQLKSLQSSNGADMSLDMGSLNELLKFNSNISASKLTSKDEVKKAVNHLRANKELLKKMIDKF